MRVADEFGSAFGSGVGGAWSRVAGVVRWSRVIWRRGPLVGSVVFGHCPSCFAEKKERVVSQVVWRLGVIKGTKLTSGPRIPRALLFHST